MVPFLNLKCGLSTDPFKVRVTRNHDIFLIKENLASNASHWSKNVKYFVSKVGGETVRYSYTYIDN